MGVGKNNKQKTDTVRNGQKLRSADTSVNKRNRRATGTVYEQAVGYYLEQQGYEILRFNYRCPLGEIDIIAKEGGCLVFCEVKYRRGNIAGTSLEAVDRRKQQTIFRCAQWYLKEMHLEEIPCRFDVIGVEGSKIRMVKNAFEEL